MVHCCALQHNAFALRHIILKSFCDAARGCHGHLAHWVTALEESETREPLDHTYATIATIILKLSKTDEAVFIKNVYPYAARVIMIS